MNPVLRKEIRLLLPAWVAALAAATIPVWVWGAGFEVDNALLEQISLIFFAAGTLLLGLSSFGLEMSLGTFSPLLAQPRPRLATWQVKIGLLALAMASVVAAGSYSWFCWKLQLPDFPLRIIERGFSPEHTSYLIILSVMAFVGGLWTTLLLRQIAGGFWFAIVVPFAFWGFSAPWAESWPYVEFVGDRREAFEMAFLAFFTLGYAIVGLCLARWLFLRAEDRQAKEATDRGAWSFLPAFPKPSQPLIALLVKEVRLQQGSLLIAVILLLLHLMAVAVSNNYPASPWNGAMLNHVWMMWLLVPLIVGCLSIAEERRIRTLDGALCLPFGRVSQFAVKLLVVFGLGVFLGAVMPWMLESMRLKAHDLSDLQGVAIAAVVAAGIGCYASSLTAALLPAIGLSIGLFVAFSFTASRLFADATNDGDYYKLWLEALFVAFCFLDYGNFKQSRIARRQWIRNGILLCVLVPIIAVVVGVIRCCLYVWDFVFYDSASFLVGALVLVFLVAFLIRGLLQQARRVT